MNRHNALKILGLEENFSDDQLKGSYRKLAKKYHPDLNKGNKEAEEKFKEVALAYEVLTKPGTAQPGRTRFEDFFGNGDVFFDDLLKNMFGNTFSGAHHQQKKLKPRPGSAAVKLNDVDLGQVRVSLVQLLFREEIKLSIHVHKVCNSCHERIDVWEPCGECGQSGNKEASFRVAGAIFSQKTECTTCKGLGWVRKSSCSECNGSLIYKKRKDLKINIPENYIFGQKIRLKGQGNESWQAENGSVYLIPMAVLPTIKQLSTVEQTKLKNLLNKL